MECNKEEAIRAVEVAENNLQISDFTAAKKMAHKALRLYPNLENISQLVAVCEVHCSAENKLYGSEIDWYGVLQIQKSADDATIRKQYRKLALLLHPDKNKFTGAEAAFKLIGEANRLLTDKTKRSLYDMKCRSVKNAAPKQPGGQPNANMNWGANNVPTVSRSQCPSVNPSRPAQMQTFWTCCTLCGVRYQYFKIYVNKMLRCQSCGAGFAARDLGNQTAPFGSHQRQAPLNQNVTRNPGPPKAAASQSKAGNISDMKYPGIFAGVDPSSKASKTFETNTASSAEQNHKEGGGVNMEAEKGGADKPKTDTTKTREQGAIKNAKRKRQRKLIVESSESFQSNDDSELAKNIPENVGDPSRQKSGFRGENHRKRSSRDKKHVSYHEDSSDNEFVSPPKRSRWNPSSTNGKAELKETNGDAGLSKADNSSAVDGECKEVKLKAGSPLEKGFPNKNSSSRGCKVMREGTDMSDHNNQESKLDGVSDTNSKNSVEPDFLVLPDADFSDFEKDKAEKCFSVDQIWAIYDTLDSMPRFYARIRKVFCPGFKLRITWLEPNPDDEDEIDWCDESMPVACGKFSLGNTEETRDRLMFSHTMHCIKSSSRGSYVIYPSKGETWAIFKDWDIKWSAEPGKHVPYKFEFVEVLSDFTEDVGIEVAYLSNVKGFVSLFQHYATESGISSFQIPPNALYRFSHQVPSFRMTGQEREEGVPKGSFELDPAALPTNLNGLGDPGDVKMKNNGFDSGKNCFSHEPSETKAEDMIWSEKSKFKSKHERKDPGIETMMLRRSPRRSTNAFMNCSQVNPSQCMTEKDSCKGESHCGQADDKMKTPKKHDNNSVERESSCGQADEKMKTPKKHDNNSVERESGCGQADEKMKTPKKHCKNTVERDGLILRRSPRDISKKTRQEDGVKDVNNHYASKDADRRMSMLMASAKDVVEGAAPILKRSPRDLNRKNVQVDTSQCLIAERKESKAVEDENHGASKSSHQSGERMHLNMKDRSPNTHTKGPTSGSKISQVRFYDFNSERSAEKVRTDQIWALYSEKDGMPKLYAQIKKIDLTQNFLLRVVFLESCSQPEAMIHPYCCGTFKVKNSKTEVFHLSAFSHCLKAKPRGKNIYEIYPRKGEVWAIYKEMGKHECDIVEVLEVNEQINTVAILTQLNGFQSVYRAPRIQRSRMSIIDVPQSELARFSHQIPAFKHTGEICSRLRGCWELDFPAIPGLVTCLE